MFHQRRVAKEANSRFRTHYALPAFQEPFALLGLHWPCDFDLAAGARMRRGWNSNTFRDTQSQAQRQLENAEFVGHRHQESLEGGWPQHHVF